LYKGKILIFKIWGEMKRIFETSILVLAIVASFSAFKPNEVLSLGKEAPMEDLPLADVNGEQQTLKTLKKEKGLLVIFSCNTCPFVLAWEDQYSELGEITDKSDIGMVLVNSNEKKRQGDDSMDEMKQHASEMNYNVPYVVDANSKLADAFGAKTTPHVFLFDENMKLVYRGSINDKYENKSKEVSKHYLKEAINQLSKGEEVSNEDTREIGCSIKRV
jgi:thioredoxin-related protein